MAVSFGCRALDKRWKLLAGAVVALALLNTALLGVTIWAGVTANKAENRSAQALQSAGNTSSGGEAASGTAGTNVLLSTSPTSPKGYTFAGSVYRGSGGHTAMTQCRSARGVAAGAVGGSLDCIG